MPTTRPIGLYFLDAFGDASTSIAGEPALLHRSESGWIIDFDSLDNQEIFFTVVYGLHCVSVFSGNFLIFPNDRPPFFPLSLCVLPVNSPRYTREKGE